MDRYRVISSLGQGSFGAVYKAERTQDKKIVAMKIISKRGRSVRELKDLERECKIQAELKHPNIIEMIESFSTKTDLFVITEYAQTDLHRYLIEKGPMPEDLARSVVCHLVSALYYLHSNRILHRDLKPQNVLLSKNMHAKLCDFGLARNMAISTVMLTSIKGTPLYMAPELLAQKPYDYEADLWSLGCIAYEIIAGKPPFYTTSILSLINLLKIAEIIWPANISNDYRGFLQSLLEKEANLRISWAQLLCHPFVEGRLYIADERSTSNSQPKPKTQKDSEIKSAVNELPKMLDSLSMVAIDSATPKVNKLQEDSITVIPASDVENADTDFEDGLCGVTVPFANDSIKQNASWRSADQDNAQIIKHVAKNTEINGNAAEKIVDVLAPQTSATKELKMPLSAAADATIKCTPINLKKSMLSLEQQHKDSALWGSSDGSRCEPIENEEWLAFLNKTLQEIFSGEYESLRQPNLLNVVIAPLRNRKSTPKVISCVAQLLSLPFVLGQPDIVTEDIKKVYINVQLVPNLLYAGKLIMCQHNQVGDSATSELNTATNQAVRSIAELNNDEIKAICALFELVCHLAHINVQFLTQFCDAATIITANEIFTNLISQDGDNKAAVRLKINIISLLACILRELPENAELVERIIFQPKVKLSDLLQHADSLLRLRACMLLRLLGRFSLSGLQRTWNDELKQAIAKLAQDQADARIQREAAQTLEELSHFANFA